MSLLGAVVRGHPHLLPVLAPRLAALPGVELAANPGDGRLVALIEDAVVEGVATPAASTLASVAQWPDVLGVSLVYEYSGPDSPAIGGTGGDYRAWRGSLDTKRNA